MKTKMRDAARGHNMSAADIISLALLPEMKRFNRVLARITKESFVSTATYYGIARWERILGLIPFSTDTLHERRDRVMLRQNEPRRLTLHALNRALKLLCGETGYSIDADYKNSTLNIHLSRSALNNYTYIDDLIFRRAPVNMHISLSISTPEEDRELLSPFAEGK